jgi:outer membrane protein assembly factor BamD (BamD/ComL family)
VAHKSAPDRPRRHRTSSLAEQNELFERAVRARQGGDLQGALQAYDALLDRYPTSALAENAIVGRMRVLAGIRPSEAATEAARYLERYPTGFARAEAEQLVEQHRAP